MHFSDRTPPQRASDADRVRDIGAPIFTLVPQMRLQERGFSWFGFSDRVARLHYWLADPSGNFWFDETPIGLMGVAELKGFVFTDVIARPDDRDSVPDEAVRHYLADALEYYSADPLEDLASGKTEYHRSEIAARLTGRDQLIVDGREHPSTVLAYRNFLATSAWVGNRLATLVVRTKDLDFLDPRLVTRR